MSLNAYDDYDWDQGDYEGEYRYDRLMRHSGLGIASFVMGAISFLCVLGMVVVAVAMEMSHPGAFEEESPETKVAELVAGLVINVVLIGLILGLGGAFL